MTGVEGNRVAAISAALTEALDASHVEVIDDSRLHAGHAGAESGGGHFRVLVVSERFEGLSRIAAQRLVYDALGKLMVGEIHALQMMTLTPAAWNATGSQAAERDPGRGRVS